MIVAACLWNALVRNRTMTRWGSRVILNMGCRVPVREAILGDGYGGKNSPRRNAELGDTSVAGRLGVRWPRSGSVQTFTNPPGNRITRVTEGQAASGEIARLARPAQ